MLMIKQQIQGIINRISFLLEKHKVLMEYSIIMCIIAYFIPMSNYLFNHDSIVGYYTRFNWLLGQGKWLAPFICKIRGEYYIRYTGIIFGAISICLINIVICMIFNIEKCFDQFIIATLITMFPSTLVINLYNGLDYFEITALLSVLAALFITRGGIRNTIIGIILLTLSLGSYQGYVAFTTAILVGKTIIDLLNNEPVGNVMRKGICYVGAVLVSICWYGIILVIALKITNTSLDSYKGMNRVTDLLNLNVFVTSIISTLKHAIKYLLDDNLGEKYISTIFCFRLFCVIVILFVGMVSFSLIKKREYIRAFLFSILMMGVLPLATNFADFLSQGQSFYFITAYGMVMIFIIPLVVISSQRDKGKVNSVMYSAVLVCLTCIVINYFINNNVQYEKARYSSIQLNTKMTGLVNDIQNAEGYTGKEKVIIVGNAPYRFLESSGVYKDAYEHTFVEGIYTPNQILCTGQKVCSYINDYFSYDMNCIEYNCEMAKYDDTIEKMGTYPMKNSINVLEDAVLVRIGDVYK